MSSFRRFLLFCISVLSFCSANAQNHYEIDPSLHFFENEAMLDQKIGKAQYSFELARMFMEESMDKILIPMLEQEYTKGFMVDGKITYGVSVGGKSDSDQLNKGFYQYDFYHARQLGQKKFQSKKVLSLRLYYNEYGVQNITFTVPQATDQSDLSFERSMGTSLHLLLDKEQPYVSNLKTMQRHQGDYKNSEKYELAKAEYEKVKMKMLVNNLRASHNMNIFLPSEVAENSLEEAQAKVEKEIKALKIPYAVDRLAGNLNWQVKSALALGIFFDSLVAFHSFAIGSLDGLIGSTLVGLSLIGVWETLHAISELYTLRNKALIRKYKMESLTMLKEYLPTFYQHKRDLKKEFYYANICSVSASK